MDWIGLGRIIVKHLRDEYALITHAPIASSLFVVIVTISIWFLVHYHYRHTVTALAATVGSKDATIETLHERHKMLNERLRLSVQEKDDLIHKLGDVATFDSAKLIKEVQKLRSELDDRQSREWLPLSEQQIRQLEIALQRNGKEEPAARTVSILVEDTFPDAIVLSEQVSNAFVQAGWSLTARPDSERLWQNMERGIGIYAPKGQPIADFLMKVMIGIFGKSVVFRREVPSLFKGMLETAAVVQVEIGRKPVISTVGHAPNIT